MLGARGRGGKIRAPKRGLTKDEVDVDATWKVLEDAFSDIHQKNASKLSFEELFRNAYKLVLKKKQETLYDRVCDFEETYLRTHVRPAVNGHVSPTMLLGFEGQSADSQANERRTDGEIFMRELKTAFQDQQLSMGMITDVLMYMDRVMSQDNRRPSIYAAVMDIFRREVLQSKFRDDAEFTTLDLLESTLLDMIQLERRGEIIDRPLIRACCGVLEGLYESVTEDETTKLYLTSFEPKFLATSRQFYHEEGLRLVAEADAGTFCAHARKRLREEEERSQQTIASSTDNKIREVVEKELISGHIKDVINMEGTGVRNMLDNDRLEDLANIFDLVSRTDPRKTHLKEAVQKRVVELGAEIDKNADITHSTVPEKKPVPKPTEPKDSKAPTEKQQNQQTQAAISWVEEILQLKIKYDRIWEVAFQKDPVMEKALEVAFQDFINVNDRSSEYVSLFFDETLKRGVKGMNESEVDAILDKGILLLQYLANTDMFEAAYRKHLARRLLMKKSVTRDMEREMLAKMKMKIGNHVTTKLEGMIKDTQLSDTLTTQYKEYVRNLGDADPKRVDLDPRILTTNQWPYELLSKTDEDAPQRICKYSQVIESAKQRYERFYHDKHTGRKLTWMPNLGDADVRATFKGADGKIKRYELNMSTYCMIVVMLFNDLLPGQGLTLEEIEAETSISTNDLKKTLYSLAIVPKWRVLRKEPSSKEITQGDTFYFNETFSSQFIRLKIGSVNVGSSRIENAVERKETQERVNNERGHAIEAAIVRIMKQRKKLTHQQLMTETLQQLASRFHPDVNMVKRKIEALIDREYLERGPDPEKPTYNYLA